jgi:hypothetical protein
MVMHMDNDEASISEQRRLADEAIASHQVRALALWREAWATPITRWQDIKVGCLWHAHSGNTYRVVHTLHYSRWVTLQMEPTEDGNRTGTAKAIDCQVTDASPLRGWFHP